jgi:hypothetical protein
MGSTPARRPPCDPTSRCRGFSDAAHGGDAATGQRARALLDLVVDLPDDWTHTVVAGDARDALDALARVDGSLLVLGLKVGSPPRTAIALAASAGDLNCQSSVLAAAVPTLT